MTLHKSAVKDNRLILLPFHTEYTANNKISVDEMKFSHEISCIQQSGIALETMILLVITTWLASSNRKR